MSLIAGILAGVVTAIVAFAIMAASVWTVIHSGWTDGAIRAYYVALYVAPLLLGLLSAWSLHGIVRSRRQ